MAIQFPPERGLVLRCDYSLGGFREPEMVKPRPATVISPRLRHRDGLCSVVPLSTTHDGRDLPYVVSLKLQLPEPYEAGPATGDSKPRQGFLFQVVTCRCQ
jgi:uncharacterized protein YifN (PemK superfamily)